MAYRKTTFFKRKSNIGLKTETPSPVPINKLGPISALKLTAVAVSLLSLSSNAAALGLGALEVQSNLDQPLNGVIELRLSDGDDINSIEALIASRDDFISLGIDYPNYMGNINLTIDSSDGANTLRVNSSDVVINEPFIHFLVRVNWAGGSFLREYTALIDPPVYAAETPRSLSEPKAVGTDETYQVEEYDDIQIEELEEPVVADSEVFDELSEEEVVFEEDTAEIDEAAIEEPDPEEYIAEEADLETDLETDTLDYEEPVETETFTDDLDVDDEYQPDLAESQTIGTDAQYGPVASGESLSVIAQELQRQFPDLSIYQIMRVLFDENRNSFIRDNINGLMKGAVLNLGDLDAIRAVDIAEARNFFYQQINEWDPSLLVASTDSSDDGLRVGQDEYNYEDLLGESGVDSATTTDSVLTDDTFQVGASTDTQSFVSATEGDNREGEVIALQQQITSLESSLSSSSLENQELIERISILEGQLTDMNRLLSLDVEDAELASIEATLADQNNSEEVIAPLQDDLIDQVDALFDDDSAGLDEIVSAEDDFSELIEDPSLSDGALDDVGLDLDEESSEIFDDALVEIDDGAESSDELYELGDDTLNGSLEDALNDELLVEESDLIEPVAASPVNAAQPSFFEKIKTMIVDNGLWKLIAGIGGLLLAGLAAIVFRRKRADEEFEISMLSIETQSQSVTKSSAATGDEEGEAKAGDRETSFLTVYSDSDAFVQADEVDPIAEADVYIAYGRDEQAEEVLLDGIASKPGRVDIKQKLLGLYHKNNNVEGFERIAEELYSQKSSLTSDLWQEVSLMGMDIAPKNSLFAVSVAELLSVNDDQAEPAETAITDPINVQDEVEEVTIEDASEAIDMALAEDDESINLINFDDGRSEVSELDRVEIDALDLDDDESIDDDYRDDFNSPNLDSGVGDEKTEFDKSDEVLVTVLADDVLDEKVDLDDVVEIDGSDNVSESVVDFDSGDIASEDTQDSVDQDSEDQDSEDQDIEVLSNVSISDVNTTDDMSLEPVDDGMSLEPVDDDVLDFDGKHTDEESAVDIQLIDEVTMTHEVSGLEIDDQYNEAKTQFELAKVFVDLGDQEGAKKILDDIIANNDNDDDVVEDAIELLDSLES